MDRALSCATAAVSSLESGWVAAGIAALALLYAVRQWRLLKGSYLATLPWVEIRNTYSLNLKLRGDNSENWEIFKIEISHPKQSKFVNRTLIYDDGVIVGTENYELGRSTEFFDSSVGIEPQLNSIIDVFARIKSSPRIIKRFKLDVKSQD